MHYSFVGSAFLGSKPTSRMRHAWFQPIGVTPHACLVTVNPLQWRHNERDGVSNQRLLHCMLICWFRRRSKEISQLRVTGLCTGNMPVTGDFPAQRANNAKNVSIWCRHHDMLAMAAGLHASHIQPVTWLVIVATIFPEILNLQLIG